MVNFHLCSYVWPIVDYLNQVSIFGVIYQAIDALDAFDYEAIFLSSKNKND